MNKLEIVKPHFERLIELYQRANEAHRAGSFRSALDILEQNFGKVDLPADISSLKCLKGIGDSTINEIKEVLQHGTSARLTKLEESFGDSQEVEISSDEVKNLLGGLLNKQ